MPLNSAAPVHSIIALNAGLPPVKDNKGFSYAPLDLSPFNPNRVRTGISLGNVNYQVVADFYRKNQASAALLVKQVKLANPEAAPWRSGTGANKSRQMLSIPLKDAFKGNKEKFAALVKHAVDNGKPVSPGANVWSARLDRNHKIAFKFESSSGEDRTLAGMDFLSTTERDHVIAADNKYAAIEWLSSLGMVEHTDGQPKFSQSREKLIMNSGEAVSDNLVGRALRHAAGKLVVKQLGKKMDGAHLYKGTMSNGVTAQAYVKKDDAGRIESMRFLPVAPKS